MSQRNSISILGVLPSETDINAIEELLKSVGVTGIEVKALPYFDDWVKGLSTENIPGLSEVCLNWISYWGKGGGDYSSEICIRDAIREHKTDVPAELAVVICNSIAGYTKSSFEAVGLAMTMLIESISELAADTEADSLEVPV